MPTPDPLPGPPHALMHRFWRTFRVLAILAVVIAAIAVVLVTRGEGEVHASLIIATALGVGLSVLLGAALMTLVFLSSSSGHDEQAAPKIRDESDDQ